MWIMEGTNKGNPGECGNISAVGGGWKFMATIVMGGKG